MVNFLDGLGSAWDWLKGGDAKNNIMTSNLGALAGSAGGLWGAYNQQKMAKDNFKLQKDAFDYNKMLSEEERKRRDRADKSLVNAFSNSAYGYGA
ncbi:hypothetical protein [Campylobacter fetus]|uniref:hypothetical protein n=1 Tax=Campylobacter fetus TaxID=196 RepID=UPI0008189138|nr:hypothetical protein [Campylobacter fetus]